MPKDRLNFHLIFWLMSKNRIWLNLSLLNSNKGQKVYSNRLYCGFNPKFHVLQIRKGFLFLQRASIPLCAFIFLCGIARADRISFWWSRHFASRFCKKHLFLWACVRVFDLKSSYDLHSKNVRDKSQSKITSPISNWRSLPRLLVGMVLFFWGLGQCEFIASSLICTCHQQPRDN